MSMKEALETLYPEIEEWEEGENRFAERHPKDLSLLQFIIFHPAGFNIVGHSKYILGMTIFSFFSYLSWGSIISYILTAVVAAILYKYIKEFRMYCDNLTMYETYWR